MPSEDNHQARVRAITGFSLAAASAGVTSRLVSRRLKGQKLFLDDWLLIVALLFEWGIATAGLFLLKNGLGQHMNDITATDLVTYLKILYSGAPLYAATIVAVKLSMLCLYRRLFPVKRMLYAAYAVGVIVITWGITVSLLGFMLCIPVRKIWEPQTPGWCFDLVPFYYGSQIPNIVTDVVIVAMPLKMILGLDFAKQQKVGLGIMFGLSIVVVVMDVFRLVALIELTRSHVDTTWDQVPTAIWTCLEPATAIACAGFSNSKPCFDWLSHYYRPVIHFQVRSIVSESGAGSGANVAAQYTMPEAVTLSQDIQGEFRASEPCPAEKWLPAGLSPPSSASYPLSAFSYSRDPGVGDSSESARRSITQASDDTVSQHTSESCTYLTAAANFGGSQAENNVPNQRLLPGVPICSSDHAHAHMYAVKHIHLSHARSDENARDSQHEQEEEIHSSRYDAQGLPSPPDSLCIRKDLSMRMKALPPLPASMVGLDSDLEQGEGDSPDLWHHTRKSERNEESAKRKSLVSQQWFSPPALPSC